MQYGVCGFCRSKKEIFENLNLLEVQKTFYKPPREETARKWRKEASPKFVFTVKAWQVITHPESSPTYRKTTIPGNKEKFGFFQPTKEVFDAFDTTAAIARLLRAEIIVFQTPAAFEPEEKNIKNMKEFFSSLGREFVYVWESRGNWTSDTVEKICKSLNLIDAVDPFRRESVTSLQYFRLHGSPPGKRMYSYTYTDEDLRNLFSFCNDDTYVLFNNVTMFEDALRFQKLIQSISGENGAAEI